MASKQDIITSVKNLNLFLKAPTLLGSTVRLNSDGSPYRFTGGFNMVFQLEKNNKKWAFRVWHVPMKDTKERFQAISRYLSQRKIKYFSDFSFDEKGLLVNGEFLDTSRMEWIEGTLLKKYITQNLTSPNTLRKLAEDFKEMCRTLRDNQISHGDLQEGNILIDQDRNIKLVDYDSVCIPEIEGQRELVTGLKGYQHPTRFSYSKASLKADYFSELIIYLSILAIAENPKLWEKYQVETSCFMLFQDADFVNLKGSKIYKDLSCLSYEIVTLLDILRGYLTEPSYLNLKPFSTLYAGAEYIKIKKEGADVKEKIQKLQSALDKKDELVTNLFNKNNELERKIDQLQLNKKQPILSIYGAPVFIIFIILSFFTGRFTNETPITPTIPANINYDLLDSVISIQPFLIKEISFENSMETSESKHTFSARNLRKVVPILDILPIADSGNIKVFCKIIDPNRNVWRTPLSKFTYETSIHLNKGTRQVTLAGWPANYSPGKYLFEAWVENRHIGTGVFKVIP